MAGLFGNAPERRNPLMLPRVNERRHDDIASMSSSLLGRPAYNTGDVIAQILAGGLAGLSDRGRANAETERSEAMMEAFGTLLGGGGGLGGSGMPGGGETYDMGSLLSQTSARSPDTSPSAAPVGPVGRRPIDGMEMPMGQPAVALGENQFTGTVDSLGIRNNNPLNLRPNGDPWQGMVGDMNSEVSGPFVQFDTPENGLRAGIMNIDTWIGRGRNTPQALFETLAPSDDPYDTRGVNDPNAYAVAVADTLGIGVNDPINWEDPNVARAVVETMVNMENGGNPYPEAIILDGINRAWEARGREAPFPGVSGGSQPMYASAAPGDTPAPVQTAQAPGPQNAGMALSASPAQPQGMSPQQQQVIGFMLANGMENEALGLIAQSAFAAPGNDLPANVQEIQWFLSQPQEVQQYLVDNGLMGGSGTNVTVNNQMGETGPNMIDVTDSVGDVWSEASTAGADASNFVAMLDTMETLFPQAITGAGSQTITELASWARRFGIDVDTSEMGATQALVTLMNRMALQVRSPDGPFGGMPGATSNRDITFLLDSIPSISQTPEGFQIAVLGMRQIFQRAQELQNLAMQYYDPQTGQVDPGFLTAYNDLIQSPIFTEDTRNQINAIIGVTPGGGDQDIAPVPNSAIGPDATFDDLITGQQYRLPDGRVIIYRGDGQAEIVD